MKIRPRILIALAAATLTIAASPHNKSTHHHIKALSPDRIEALQTGAGAGYALPAELNGYPGPRHVLDLADALHLTQEQRQETARLFERMKAEAIPMGRKIIQQETDLDALFRHKRADETGLFQLTSAIGASEARLRATHLKYHLIMADMLTPPQRAAYSRLRGYGSH
ncbi:MAG: hypothetical protein HOM58_12385 [Rhodospirillaceae bacterium]|nr:hypothetical protein [Rhodospirillaceae bacterium]MBT5457760.1 hypothetical protein [Rhodospirillaceae bacterium]